MTANVLTCQCADRLTDGRMDGHTHTPVLADVDIVYLVCHDGQLGDCLNHMIALQHQVTLEDIRPKVKVKQQSSNSTTKTITEHDMTSLTFCLLSVVGICKTKNPSLRELTEIPTK